MLAKRHIYSKAQNRVDPFWFAIGFNVKVIFSDESGQNLTWVKPTQYDGRSPVKSG